MTGTCVITRATTGGSRDGNNVWLPSPREVIYAGVCRINPPGGVSNPVIGDQRIGTTDYPVAIPWDAPEILEHDIVEIRTARDPQLLGRKVMVTDPVGAGGTEQFERVLTCTQDITQREA